MEILGIGVPELIFIVVIALLVLGPKDMLAAGKTLGRGLRKFILSPEWQAMRRTGEELQQLPTKLMREANLEELQAVQDEIRQSGQQLQKETQKLSQPFLSKDIQARFDERQPLGGSPEQPAAPPETPTDS